MCFDVDHAYTEAENDGIERFLSNYGDLVTYLHVHDVRGHGDTHLPIGAGEIHFEALSEYVPEFAGAVAIKVFSDDEPLLSDTARRIEHHLAGR